MTFHSEIEKRCAYAALDLASEGQRITRRAVALRASISLDATHRLLTGLEARGLIVRGKDKPTFHGSMFRLYGRFEGSDASERWG